jgi:hypothetical protein
MGHDLPERLWPLLVDEIVTHAKAVQPSLRDSSHSPDA